VPKTAPTYGSSLSQRRELDIACAGVGSPPYNRAILHPSSLCVRNTAAKSKCCCDGFRAVQFPTDLLAAGWTMMPKLTTSSILYISVVRELVQGALPLEPSKIR
jgi:hypothetical protein